MKTKEVELWELYGEDDQIVVDSDDISQKVSFFETNAYLFPKGADTDALRELVAEYQKRKEQDPYLSFFELLDKAGIEYEIADESEDYRPDLLICFPDEPVEWAICTMGDLEGVSDVYQYWDGSNWREIWAEVDVERRILIVIDENAKESLDKWDGQNWYYRSRFNHANLYKIISINNEPVEGKWLLWEWSQWQGSLDRGEIVEEGDLERIRSWAERPAEEA